MPTILGSSQRVRTGSRSPGVIGSDSNQEVMLQNDAEEDSEKGKLTEEIEDLKSEQPVEPIFMKVENNGEDTNVLRSLSLSPNAEDFRTTNKVRNRTRGSESSPLPLSTDSESGITQISSQHAGKLKSDELAQIASFGLVGESSLGRSASVVSKGAKSFSGIPSVIKPHNYFASEYDHETSSEKYQFAPTTGIHGNTSKVVATQHRRKAWDWNSLPKVGSTVLVRTHSFNVISVPIDGEIKQILYTPLYNKNFKRMNIFLSFNMDTKPWDALAHSRRRILSFVNFIKHYLKSRAYAYQCYPFFLQGLSEEDTKTQNYVSYHASHDYTEIESIISLWSIQAQKLVIGTNSIFFSSEAIEGLLQRKSSARNRLTVQGTVLLHQNDDDLVTSRPVVTEPLEEIDILLLRTLPDDEFGWQLAYDEPNLNIVDYALDITPWTAHDAEAESLSGTSEPTNTFQGVKIVSKQEQLEKIDTTSAAYYLFDCMDRRISDMTEEAVLSAAQKAAGTSEDNGKDTGSFDASKKKNSHGKLGKRSGLAGLFKRKHAHPIPQSTQSEAPPPPASPEGKVGARTQSIQNAWLEDYFSKCLGNYKRLRMPTQYFLSHEASSSKSEGSSESEKAAAKKAILYNKECLQIVLPFADNVMPSIYAPWFWSDLGYTRWRSLLREVYRCLAPGGFALGSVCDLKVSNTFTAPTDDSMQEFPTTMEREKLLDAMTLVAMNNGIHIYPTRHLVQAFREVGFTNIKYSLLSLKTGDLSTDMGCLNELFSQVTSDLIMRKQMPDPNKPPKDTDPATLFQRYTTEHLDKVDENAGCMRTLLVVAQKPRKIASQ